MPLTREPPTTRGLVAPQSTWPPEHHGVQPVVLCFPRQLERAEHAAHRPGGVGDADDPGERGVRLAERRANREHVAQRAGAGRPIFVEDARDLRGTEHFDQGAAELLEFPLPAVVSIDEGVARPRYPSLKGIMAAKKKPLEVKPAQLGDVRMTVSTMALPPERPPGRILGEGVAAVPELVRLLQTEAKVL